MHPKVFDFGIKGDERGLLVALEENCNIPFEIKRVYYIYATQFGVARGFHAHKELQQVAVCVCGSCKFLLDNGISSSELILNKPNKGLLIDKMVWHEMFDFSKDCVLLVLANEKYIENDYIRDYEQFKREI